MAVWSSIKLSELGGAYRLDPEFCRPEYVAVEKALRKLPHQLLGDLAVSLRKGVFNILAESYVESGIPFYRSSNVGVIAPKAAGLVFITPARHKEEKKTALKRGDIMLAKTGKEAASVVLVQECNVSQDVVAIRIDQQKINPFFVAVYLNTTPGILQMRRWFQGQVQMHLALPDVRQLLIPIPDVTLQNRVQATIEEHERLTLLAETMLENAERTLLAALNLDGLDLTPTLSYSRQLTHLLEARRFGAEYFMPAKTRVLSALAAMPHRLMSDHFACVKELFQPEKAPEGKVRNYDLSDALDLFLDETTEPCEGTAIGSTKKRFSTGDVVVSRLRSYLREIAIVRAGPKPPCVGSSEFIVLRPNGSVSAETLLVYLRSMPVQAILKWSQDGSNHPRFTEEDLLAIPVPEMVVKIAGKVEKFVNQAIDCRQQAAALLIDAKQLVETIAS